MYRNKKTSELKSMSLPINSYLEEVICKTEYEYRKAAINEINNLVKKTPRKHFANYGLCLSTKRGNK